LIASESIRLSFGRDASSWPSLDARRGNIVERHQPSNLWFSRCVERGPEHVPQHRTRVDLDADVGFGQTHAPEEVYGAREHLGLGRGPSDAPDIHLSGNHQPLRLSVLRDMIKRKEFVPGCSLDFSTPWNFLHGIKTAGKKKQARLQG